MHEHDINWLDRLMSKVPARVYEDDSRLGVGRVYVRLRSSVALKQRTQGQKTYFRVDLEYFARNIVKADLEASILSDGTSERSPKLHRMCPCTRLTDQAQGLWGALRGMHQVRVYVQDLRH